MIVNCISVLILLCTWVYSIVNVQKLFMVAVDGPSHSRPWLLDTEMSRHIGAFQLITLCTAESGIVLCHYIQRLSLSHRQRERERVKGVAMLLLTCSSISTGSMPKNGLMGKPGLGVESSGPGRGVMAMPPVSADHIERSKVWFTQHARLSIPVCHHVSTTVHLPSPTTLWYHSQASSFNGSPTAAKKTCTCMLHITA